MRRIRAAYSYQKEFAAVPWKNRVGIALFLVGVFLAAGLTGDDPLWILLVVCSLPISLVVIGIAIDIYEQ